METKTIILAFDIERSGGTDIHDTIAIGASVVDDKFNELDSLFLPGYFPDESVFEKRCWEEFWSKNKDILDTLIYDGPLNKKDREFDMITSFQNFRNKWEKYCEQNCFKYELVADNNVYDGGFINQLIYDYLPDTMPLPYNSQQKYKQFWETHSEQRGLLLAVDPDFVRKNNSGFSNRINQLYDVPPMKKYHDHNPANDAYTIAFEQQVLLNIRDDIIKLRKIL